MSIKVVDRRPALTDSPLGSHARNLSSGLLVPAGLKANVAPTLLEDD